MKKRFLLQKLPFMAFLLPAFILSFSSLNLNAKPTTFNEPNIPVHLEFLPNFAMGTSSWTLNATVNDVECYYMIATCNGSTSVFLRFNNKNAGNVKITWEESFQTQLESGLPGSSSTKELILLPGYTAENDCSKVDPLTIIHSFQVAPTYPSVIKSYNFINVKVTTI
jgi:hypothetical protein